MDYTKINLEEIKNELKQMLSQERYLHSIGTAEMAVELAEKFNQDKNKAEIAGLLHDSAKNMTVDELRNIIKQENLDVDESELENPKTLHAPVSAYLARKKFNIYDEEILSAIRFHTVAKLNMSDFEKIIFLADKIERKTRDEKYSSKIVEKLSEPNGLDKALLTCHELTIKSLVDRKLSISYLTVNIYNELVRKFY